MKEFYKNYLMKNLPFHILTAFAVLLIVASFILPPMGVVDGSVLAAVGEIFAFASLGTVIAAIDKGVDAKVKHGDTELTIGDFENKKDEE